LEREKSVIVQEIGAAQDTPDDVVFEHLNDFAIRTSRWALALRNGQDLEGLHRDTLRGYLTRIIAAGHGGGGGGRVDHKRVVEEVTRRFSSSRHAGA